MIRLAYVTKTAWGQPVPGLSFSVFNAYAFALNGVQTTLFLKQPLQSGSIDLEGDLGLKPLPNFGVTTLSDRLGPLHANEIYFSRVNRLLTNALPWDLVLTRDAGYLPYLIRVKNRLGARAVYQSHNFYMDPTRSINRRRNWRKTVRCEQRCIPRLDGMLALNTPHKELYEAYVSIPIFAGKPGLLKIHPSPDNFSRHTVFYSGSFQVMKGLNVIIRAFASIANGKRRLILAGGRNEGEIRYARELVQDYGIKEQTEITGWLPYTELSRHLAKATVGVIPLEPILYNQYLTAPSKLFDYLSFGIPIVASDLPAIRDLVEGPDNALLIPPADSEALAAALEQVLTSRETYQQLRNRSQALAQRSLWKDRAAAMLAFMMEC